MAPFELRAAVRRDLDFKTDALSGKHATGVSLFSEKQPMFL